MKTSYRSRASGPCARPVSPACVPTRTEAARASRSAFAVCADRVAAARTQLSFPPCPVTLTAMAKKSKKAAPEEEAPKKKGKKKAAAKK